MITKLIHQKFCYAYIFFIALLILGQPNQTNAQVTSLCNCLDIENLNSQQITTCNSIIANSFAPMVYQIKGSSNALDRFVEIDFDGTIRTDDNWHHAVLAQFHDWTVYYSVHWIDDSWYIIYSFFYPRDWAQTGIPFCSNDEHENDLARVVVKVKRPYCNNYNDCLNYNFQSNINVFATHHGEFSVGGICGESIEFASSGVGNPKVYNSAGSHAFYLNALEAKSDGINPCTPNNLESFNLLYFPTYQITGNEEQFIVNGQLENEGIFPYNLYDVTDTNFGMWQYKNNSTVFFLNGGSITDDQFHCTDGGGCPERKASAPWKSWGLTPLRYQILVILQILMTNGYSIHRTVRQILFMNQ